MPTHLFTVDDVFEVGDRYVIPTPGVPVSVHGMDVGLPIELRRPDGTVLQTEVASLPLLDPYEPTRPRQIALRGVTKRDVPIGTEIWTRDEQTTV
jgi:hypothetical protein